MEPYCLLARRIPTSTNMPPNEQRTVLGVRAISEGIRVGKDGGASSDEGIAKAVARALEQDANVPSNVQATVEAGWVTLRGEVATAAEREAALTAVQDRAGVRRIYNLIAIKTAD